MHFLVLAPLVTIPAEFHFPPAKPTDWSLNLAYQYGFARCICGFVLGMMTYHAFKDRWAKKILGNGWTMIGCTAAAFMSMHLNLPDIITVLFFPFIILSGAYGSNNINKVFATKPLQRLGSLVIFHLPDSPAIADSDHLWMVQTKCHSTKQSKSMGIAWLWPGGYLDNVFSTHFPNPVRFLFVISVYRESIQEMVKCKGSLNSKLKV